MIQDTVVPSSNLAQARNSLADARIDLDDAVRSLSPSDGDTVMAPSNLVGLLLRVVTAKRRLEDIERPRMTNVPVSFR